MPLAGVLVSLSHSREQVETRSLVVRLSQNLLEQILASPPETMAATYAGSAYALESLEDTNVSGAVGVAIDSTNSKLLVVTVTANWVALGSNHSLSLLTYVHNTGG